MLDIRIVLLLAKYHLLKFLLLFPLKKNKIFFESYNGESLSCNPHYVYNELKSMHPDWEYVWCYNYDTALTRSVKFHTLSYFYNILTSNIYITNNSVPCLPFRKSQLVISTWHGGGAYKRVGSASSEWDAYQATQKRLSANCTTLFVSSSKKFTEVMSYSFYIGEKKFCPIGMPRNDMFFNADLISNARKKVRKNYSVHNDCKIVLYAPTYRKKGEINQLSLNPQTIMTALEEKFGDKFLFLLRGHYHASIVYDDIIVDASNYPNMQELLCAADVLISDYSSCIWDFSFTYRPCFLFVPDLIKYENERDFYIPINEWGFPVAETEDELLSAINKFELPVFVKNMNKHHTFLGSYEQGTATNSLCNIIVDFLRNSHLFTE